MIRKKKPIAKLRKKIYTGKIPTRSEQKYLTKK